MKELYTEIEIEASPKKVWDLLTDFASFSDWNPFIKRAAGELKPGARLEFFLQPVGGSGMAIKPTLLKAEPGKELRWIGRIVMPGLFDGEHSFTIEARDETRVRFIQREVFTGLLVPLMPGNLERGTRNGFEAMNRALKARAEGSKSQPAPAAG